jgi:hypothetical protein
LFDVWNLIISLFLPFSLLSSLSSSSATPILSIFSRPASHHPMWHVQVLLRRCQLLTEHKHLQSWIQLKHSHLGSLSGWKMGWSTLETWSLYLQYDSMALKNTSTLVPSNVTSYSHLQFWLQILLMQCIVMMIYCIQQQASTH